MKNFSIINLVFLLAIVALLSCSHKLKPQSIVYSSVIDILNDASQKKKSKKHVINTHVYERRMKAVKLFNIEVDTSKLNRFIVVDVGNFEGADYLGEIECNDSLKYYYTSSYFISDSGIVVKRFNCSPLTFKTARLIFDYLKSHRFAELEALANEKVKTLSGSSFYSIGMYEKGMNSVYVKLLPAFIIN